MSEWQTIETAPKDGSVVLLCYPVSYATFVAAGMWRPNLDDGTDFPWVILDNGVEDGLNGWTEDAPTHWMPLPEPPK